MRAAAAALALVLPLIGTLAQAACPLQDAVLGGSVVSAADGTPVAGAAIEASWTERAAGRMSLNRNAGADGAFSLRVSFDTYSGRTITGRDICEAKLASVSLVVSHAGFDTLETEVAAAQFAAPLRLELRPAR
jgi:hypothetical protein